MIEVNETYKYKELCTIRGESVKTGKSKQLQLKDWQRYFTWENPTKQTFLITEVYDAPFEKIDNRGGYREGSGAKVKIEEEFEYLFNAFLWRELERNGWSRDTGNPTTLNKCEARFTNKEICLYFGFYNEKFYSYHRTNDEKVDESAFDEIKDKIRQKLDSWVYSKIKKMNVEFTYGIIAYYGDKNKNFNYKDEFLEDWNKYQEQYLKLNEYSGLYEVFNNDEYTDMIDYISSHFEGYNTVIKCRKVNFDYGDIYEYEWSEYNKHIESLNIKLVKELKRYFHKKYPYRVEAYDYIIDKYVALTYKAVEAEIEIDEEEYDFSWLNDLDSVSGSRSIYRE